MKLHRANTALMITAAVVGLIGVAFGAGGAHALRRMLEERNRVGTFETAVFYQLIHAWVPFACVWLGEQRQAPLAPLAGWTMICGVILFSGSLYALSLLELRIPGAAPVGGLLMMLAWGIMIVASLRRSES
jgi:uncharacterized membrane protein YgdD (TMEM256/DUF423 family)